MNKKPVAIAKVRLNRGNVAFFCQKSRLHLTLANRDGIIYDNMDLKNIKRNVKNGTLMLLSGTLTPKESVPEVENKEYVDIQPKILPTEQEIGIKEEEIQIPVFAGDIKKVEEVKTEPSIEQNETEKVVEEQEAEINEDTEATDGEEKTEEEGKKGRKKSKKE